MSNFFSFILKKNNEVCAIVGNDRLKYISKHQNPDSLYRIAEHYGLNDGEGWEFEVPLPEDLWFAWDIIVEWIMKNLKYEGGLPEKDLEAKHLDAIKRYFQKLDPKLLYPEIFEGRERITILKLYMYLLIQKGL